MGPNIDTSSNQDIDRIQRAIQVVGQTLPNRVIRIFAAANSLATPASAAVSAMPLSCPMQSSALIPGAIFRVTAFFTINDQAATGDSLFLFLTLGSTGIAIAASGGIGGGGQTKGRFYGFVTVGAGGAVTVFGDFKTDQGVIQSIAETDSTPPLTGNPGISFAASWTGASGNYIVNNLLVVEQVN